MDGFQLAHQGAIDRSGDAKDRLALEQRAHLVDLIYLLDREVPNHRPIVRIFGVDDVGRVVNATIVHGQTHAGLAQGVGQTVFEEIRYDPESGQMLTGSLMDHALPRADDLPDFETVLYEDEATANYHQRVKGAGESGAVGAPSAVASAIVDALRPHGVEHLDMPLTPERVWRALRDAKRI